MSIYGTSQIYAPGNGFYGGLNQNSALQEQVFDDLSNVYYHNTYSGYSLYGQPIIRWDNMYIVILWCGGSRTDRRVLFMCVTGYEHHPNAPYSAGTTKNVNRKKILNGIGLNMDYSGGEIYGMEWASWQYSEEAQERVYEKGFIGLKDVQTNEYTGMGNIFNQHSNYEYINPF